MYNYYTDDQNSCKKPAIAQSIQTPMKATIICLPPILHTCQNVPAADRASGATAAIIKPLSINGKTNSNNNNKNNNKIKTSNITNDPINNSCSGYSNTVASTTIRGGSCCHHWEHKNYDYEKHQQPRTTATATTATATATEGAKRMVTKATPTTRQHNQQKGQENVERQNNNNNVSVNVSNNNKNNNNATTHQQHALLCLKNGSASLATRERRRHFYNFKENITSLTLSSTCPSSLSTTMTMTPSSLSLSPASPSPSLSWRCRTMAKIAESTSQAFANRTSLAATVAAATSTRPSSSVQSSTSSFWPPQYDLQINCNQKMSNAVCYNDDKRTAANDRNLWRQLSSSNSNENVCLVDSFTLRNKQLVMPIVTESSSSRQRRRRHSSSSHCNEHSTMLMCSKLPERQTPAVVNWLQARDVARSSEIENWRTTTAAALASLTFTSAPDAAAVSANDVSQTTKKQNAFPDECELLSFRATTCPQTQTTRQTTTTIAGDIITHDEVKNFRWSDDDDNNGNKDAVGDRNCSTATLITYYRLKALQRQQQQAVEQQQQQQKQHPVKLSRATTLYPAQSRSLLRKCYNDDSNNVQRQQLLWQMSLVVWVLALLQEHRHQVVKMFTTSTASKLLLSTFMMLMLITTANCWAGRQDVPTNCTFPLRWEGSWFLSGYQQSIHIKGSQISYRGRCAASDGNKYLIVDEKGCHRCLVIYEKHENVLQYKESECEGDSMYMHQSNPSAMAMRSVLKQNNGGEHRGGAHPNTNGHSRLSSSDQYIMRSNDDMNDCPPDFCKGRETLQNLCDQIPGDALLYSLFRENAEPVKCPLKGPFVFTYNRGHGECKSPVSNIESCTEDSRLLLSFQACPDVQGTESTVEELTCLAAWKDGNSRYLVGLVSHHHAISNEERYRCFVYEKISTLMGGPSLISTKDAEYKLAQSGDATCNGLDSAEVGSRIMTLRKPPVAERCDFPAWFKGPRHWHALMGNAVYNYHTNDGSVHIIKSNGYMETRALCEQINKQTATEMMAVVHYTTGCQSGFMCMLFYRRDTHVIEIQTGKQASRLEDACAPDHFDVHKMPYITLLASNPDPQICPMEGLYNLRGAIGPPYMTTRHKRNHNNKAHNSHGHHHFSGDGFSSISSGNIAPGSGNIESSSDIYGRKRRGSLSFRNSDRIEKLSWHANTRGLPARSRRDAVTQSSSSTSTNLTAAAGVLTQTNDTTSNVDDGKELSVRAKHTQNDESYKSPAAAGTTTTPTMTKSAINATTATLMMAAATTMTIASTDLAIIRQRNRRDVPGCITNFKAQRQLWVGCTEPNVIDVRPLCNDEGDEEYYCHGSWTENTTVYIIARHKRTKHGVCITYRPTEGTAAKLVIGDACYRGSDKPPEHHLVANLSVFGKCGETGAASSTKLHIFSYSITLAVSIFATFYSGSWNKLSFNEAAFRYKNNR